MTLATGDLVTLVKGDEFCNSLTLDINIQRAYWLQWQNEGYVLFSTDYDGNNKTSFGIHQPLNEYILDVSERSIFLMQNDQSRILMVNKTQEDVFRSFTIEKSDYYKLIMFNKVNHLMGK